MLLRVPPSLCQKYVCEPNPPPLKAACRLLSLSSPPSLSANCKSLRHQEDQLVDPSLLFSLLPKPTLQILGPELGVDIVLETSWSCGKEEGMSSKQERMVAWWVLCSAPTLDSIIAVILQRGAQQFIFCICCAFCLQFGHEDKRVSLLSREAIVWFGSYSGTKIK